MLFFFFSEQRLTQQVFINIGGGNEILINVKIIFYTIFFFFEYL